MVFTHALGVDVHPFDLAIHLCWLRVPAKDMGIKRRKLIHCGGKKPGFVLEKRAPEGALGEQKRQYRPAARSDLCFQCRALA